MTELLETSANFIDYVVKNIDPIELNWIGVCIKWLIEGIGIIGVGVIVFTLILKCIVLPLDIYSRVKMKKQSLIMEDMRPQMEKLQQQYANDKNMYNQKVMELQKKNGYSVFSACIPTIVSLVIFLFVFNAFSTYSQYANLNSYNDMVDVYNESVEVYIYDEIFNSDGFLIETVDSDGEVAYLVEFDNFVAVYQSVEGNEGIDPFEGVSDENEKLNIVKEYIVEGARQAVYVYYQSNDNSFLWVKNIWYPDSMLSKEIPSYSTFKSAVSRANIGDDYEASYNEVTYALSEEKDTYNGYFVLILLAIGGMLLQQFISMRSNKASNELSTVDGEGARTNKMMMVMMPLIYGVFSFFYSAAFSIYMITNTLFSIVTTLIINKSVDVSFKKKAQKAEIARYSRK